jgi:hypothetical protein
MMRLQFGSSAEAGERQRTAAIQTVAGIFVLVWSLAADPVGLAYPYCKSSVETVERFRFQITGCENHLPISGAAVSPLYARKNATTTEENKQTEVKTDKNGFAEFGKVRADRLALIVTVKD